MYRRILVGYDGSKSGRLAFDSALALAQRDAAELHVLAVARPPEIGDDVESEAVIENSRSYLEKLLQALRRRAGEAKVKAHFKVAVGHPAEQIIYYADRHGADLIVVGDRGRSKFARLLLGSVSKQVVQYASQPVMIVR
jgi:nucleotide-binding universal stress UspA family protein